MADTAFQRMTVEEFLIWCETRDGERWELVRGAPVKISPTEAMAGAKRVHDIITANILAGLHMRLKGGPLRPYTADFAVRTNRDESVGAE